MTTPLDEHLMPLLVEYADREGLDISERDIREGHHRIEAGWWLAEAVHAAAIEAARQEILAYRDQIRTQMAATETDHAVRHRVLLKLEHAAFIVSQIGRPDTTDEEGSNSDE